MCRGKAAQDFSGPDCRFLKFKKGETIYVYYKLAGRRTDVWAGSVGSSFGYFPKDLLKINHIYTEKELEIPTEETDFVCFDGGLDKFEIYDLDKLLGSYGLLEGTNTAVPETSSSPPLQHEKVDKSTKSQAEEIEKEISPEDSNSQEAGGNKTEIINYETSSSVSEKEKNKDMVIKGSAQNALGTETSQNVQEEPNEKENPTHTVEENQTIGTDEDLPHPLKDYDAHQNTETSSPDDSTPNDNAEETSISQGEGNLSSVQEDGFEINNAEELLEEQPIPELKTKMESTFDAVVSNDEKTWKVTPVYDDFSFEENDEETHHKVDKEHGESSEASNVTPLLSYSEGNIQPEVDNEDDSEEQNPDQQENLLEEQSEIYEDHATEEEIPEDKSLWTTLGDTVFAIVSGGERTSKVTDFEDDEEQEDVEDVFNKEEEPKEDRIYLLGSEKREDQENILEMPEAEIEDLEQWNPDQQENLLEEQSEIYEDHATEEEIPEDKSLWTTLGDTVFAIVSGGERTSKVTDFEDDEEQEDVEDVFNKEEEPKEDRIYLLGSEKREDQENILEMPEAEIEDLEQWVTNGHLDYESQVKNVTVSSQNIAEVKSAVDGGEFKSGQSALTADHTLTSESAEMSEISSKEIIEDRENAHDFEKSLHDKQKEIYAKKEETLKDRSMEESDGSQAKKDTSTQASEQHDEETDLKDDDMVDQNWMEDLGEENVSEKLESRPDKEATKDVEQSGPEDYLKEIEQEQSDKTEAKSRKTGHVENEDFFSEQKDKKLVNETTVEDTDEQMDDWKPEASNETVHKSTDKSETGEILEKTGPLNTEQTVEPELHIPNEAEEEEEEEELLEDENAKVAAAALNNTENERGEEITVTSKTEKLEIVKKMQFEVEVESQQVNNSAFKEAHNETDIDVQDDMETGKTDDLVGTDSDTIERPAEKIAKLEITKPESDNVGAEDNSAGGEEALIKVNSEREHDGLEYIEANIPELSEKESIVDPTIEIEIQEEEQPDYSDGVRQLTLLKGLFDEKHVERFLNYLTPQHILLVEAMFHDLEDELKLTRQTSKNKEDIEKSLDRILESSVTRILDEIEKMVDERQVKYAEMVEMDKNMFDEKAAVFDDFQEMAFHLRQKYSTASDSTPLAPGVQIPESTVGSCPARGLATRAQFLWDAMGAGDHNLPRGILDSHNSPLEDPPCMTEKQLGERIQQLIKEKCEVLEKISELKQKIEESEQQLVESEKTKSSSARENEKLQETFKALQQNNENLIEKLRTLQSAVEEEKKKNLHQEERMSDTQKSFKKFQSLIKSKSAELSKVQTCVEGARLKEAAVKAELQSVLKENNTLKDSKKKVLSECITELRLLEAEAKCETAELQKADAKSNGETQVMCVLVSFQMSDTQKSFKKFQSLIKSKSAELSKVQTCVEGARLKEAAVKAELQSVLKENNTLKDSKKKVLSECITELRLLEAEAKCETAELQKADAESNGETQGKKNDAMKNKIKQMTDVSRIKTTLIIVEEERDRYRAKLLDEENSRHQLEELSKKLEHDHASLNSKKSHLEIEFKSMQQKLEIMNELYQQKENALQQKLTQEEYERREKEQKLSEVDSKAVQAGEELKIYKQRIQEIEEELQKTERSYKIQIASHEKKAHENWLNARAAERTLVEEKRETSNLRQKLVEVNDKLAEIQRPSLIKPTPGRPDRQIPPPRRGTLSRDDCYGPSPVSGGDPSPPPMIEGPGRPPSAPVGRREPFGHMDGQFGPRRPPSETSGRFSVPEHGLPPPFRADVGVCAPPLMSSGPRTSSPSIQLDGSMNSKAEGPPFPGTPIMNSPVTGPAHPPPSKGFAPPPMTRPPNGNAPLPLAGHPLPAPGPRYGPPHPVRGPYGPRPYGPAPPLNVRGPPHRDYPPGPPPPFGLRDFAPGMRDLPSGFPPPHGPRDYPFPPKNMPPGTVPPPGMRDYPGPHAPPPQMGPRDFKAGPPVPPQMGPRDCPPGPGLPPQQMQPRDFSSNSQNGP
ncbi:UNVERIFIED_CONTAM: hypothetical protein FKN15_052075 [Acipenser sinensis]